MNKQEILKGIDLVISGLSTIKNEISTVENTGAPVTATIVEDNSTVPTLEDLKAMKYNEFKKFAASLNVKCTGTRDEIMERVLKALGNVPEAVADDESEAEDTVDEEVSTPSKSDRDVSGKKSTATKTSESRDAFDEQAEEIAESTDVEDIIEALADVGIKATKRTAVKKLATALRDGLIELEDENEDDEDEEDEDLPVAPADDEDEESEIDSTSYFPEYDPDGLNDPDEMTKKRAKAVVKKVDSILTDFSEEELTIADIEAYIEDNATDEEFELLGDDYSEEDVLKLYIELVKRTIDNEGVEHEPADPYEVGDSDLCCGHVLKYVKKTKKYVCEHCGTEYEAE